MENSGGGMIIMVLWMAIMLVAISGMWRMFSKAGKPGWACIIPIYNVVVMLQIAGRPVWWLILMFIPVVNIFIVLITVVDIAKAFGKGAGFGVGMFFLAPIFYAILGFGDARYVGVPAR